MPNPSQEAQNRVCELVCMKTVNALKGSNTPRPALDGASSSVLLDVENREQLARVELNSRPDRQKHLLCRTSPRSGHLAHGSASDLAPERLLAELSPGGGEASTD